MPLKQAVKRTTDGGETLQHMLDRESPSAETTALKDQLRRLMAENDRLKASIGGDLELFEAVRASIPALPAYRPAEIVPTSDRGHSPSAAVLVLTDAHCDEAVRPEEMEGLAEYNLDIYDQRMSQVAEKVVEMTSIIRHSSRVDELWVWVLGDWFMGTIHPDELVGSSAPLPLSLPHGARTLADTIMKLAGHFRQVHVVGMVGNHGRTTMKPVSKMTADRNWDMSAYLIAREYSRNAANVEWTLPKSVMHVEQVMGHNCLLTHGANIKITHRVPYFAITDSFAREHVARRETGTDFDYAFVGHFHQYSHLDGNIIMCPPLIGDSQYGRYNLHVRGRARQWFGMFNERHGLTCSWPINLA